MTARLWDGAVVKATGEAIEDAAIALTGRDLGTVHRDAIARAALDAAADAVEGAIRAEAKPDWVNCAHGTPRGCMSYRCGSNCDQTYDRMHPCLACVTAEAGDLRERLAEALAPVAALVSKTYTERKAGGLCFQCSIDLANVLGDPDAVAKHNAAITAKAVAPVLAVLNSATRGLVLDMGSVLDHTVKVGHLRAALCTCGAIEYGALTQHLTPCPLARTTEGTADHA